MPRRAKQPPTPVTAVAALVNDRHRKGMKAVRAFAPMLESVALFADAALIRELCKKHGVDLTPSERSELRSIAKTAREAATIYGGFRIGSAGPAVVSFRTTPGGASGSAKALAYAASPVLDAIEAIAAWLAAHPAAYSAVLVIAASVQSVQAGMSDELDAALRSIAESRRQTETAETAVDAEYVESPDSTREGEDNA